LTYHQFSIVVWITAEAPRPFMAFLPDRGPVPGRPSFVCGSGMRTDSSLQPGLPTPSGAREPPPERLSPGAEGAHPQTRRKGRSRLDLFPRKGRQDPPTPFTRLPGNE